jgi:hypothetical protein
VHHLLAIVQQLLGRPVVHRGRLVVRLSVRAYELKIFLFIPEFKK